MVTVDLELPYLSQNNAYRVHHNPRTDQRWVGHSTEFEGYKNTVREIVQYEAGIDSPLTGPLELWITIEMEQQHRSNDELEGLPYADVDNPLKPVLDALEGVLYKDDTQIQAIHAKKVLADSNSVLIRCEEAGNDE